VIYGALRERMIFAEKDICCAFAHACMVLCYTEGSMYDVFIAISSLFERSS
jgi:hypothetical protein